METIESLEEIFEDMQRKLKGVSQYIKELEDVMVFQLEDRAYISLPKLLESDFGVRLKERLVRRYIKTNKGETMEINIIAKGEKDGKDVYIIGEAKANLSMRHVVDFIDRLEDLKETFQMDIISIMVTYMAEPEVKEFAKSKGIKVYYSYDFQPVF